MYSKNSRQFSWCQQKYSEPLLSLIYQHDENTGLFEGKVEVNESCFGGHRKGKRDRGAAGKIPVFGLLKRDGEVFAVIIPNTGN